MNTRFVIQLFASVVCSLDASAQNKAFTVDVMVQAEGVGEAAFSPRGDRLLLERIGAYETSENFAWQTALSRERVQLLSLDLRGKASPRPLSTGENERVWLASSSPDGQRAAIGWFDKAVVKGGVYDFASGELRKFDFRMTLGVGTSAFDCPLWLSDEEFIYLSPSAEEQMKQISEIAYTEERTHQWARQTWRGREAAVKVLVSGADADQELHESGTLLRVNARTGRVAALGRGLYRQLLLSPDRRRLATVGEIGNRPLGETSVNVVDGDNKLMELLVYPVHDGKPISPCRGCNVTRGSLRWAPGGDKLFFAVRRDDSGKPLHEFYIYDFRHAKLERFAPKGVAFEMQKILQAGAYIAPFAWLTDDIPAVRITSKSGSSAKDIRHDWYALPPGRGPVALTSGLTAVRNESSLADYITVRRGRMLMMIDGDLWQLSADGKRKNLTHDVSEDLSPWCSVIPFWREYGEPPVCSGLRPHFAGQVRPVELEGLELGWLSFRVMRDGVFTGDLLFLNVEDGQIKRLSRPDPQAELLTASAATQTALYQRKGGDGDRLLLTSMNAPQRELLHFNKHLAGIEAGKAVMLTRREPADIQDRYDWLLLPPGHQDGDRPPLLVYFYPDTQYSKEIPREEADLRSVSILNQRIPAARGFAVLLASMRISTMEERGEPMREMHEQLIHAAQNVVEQGYADPQRWAIIGHSYGGYGVNCVVTQTDRFRAAVSIAGISNLTSAYAQGMSRKRAVWEDAELSMGARWSEGGQGRMGVPPWQNPERYIANSPLFQADKIRTPLMLIHGDADYVNVSEAEQMFNALYRQGKDAVFLRYWGEDHEHWSPPNIRDVWNRIFIWLDEKLDIARDAQGNVVYANHGVRRRSE